MGQWKELLRESATLPVLPEVLDRIRRQLHDLDIDLDQLCGELERDRVLVGEVLQTVRSPLFGVQGRIESLRQAVTRLGLRRVRPIILAESLRQALASYQSPAFRLFQWWDRAILTAVVAAKFAVRSAPEYTEEAYLAGLAADLGVVVLARIEPGYANLLSHRAWVASEDLRVASRAVPDADRTLGASLHTYGWLPAHVVAARALWGADHATLGAGILEHWEFPEHIVDAIRRHHDPIAVLDDPGSSLRRFVQFASLVTDCVATGREDLCTRLRHVAGDCMFMKPPEVPDFVADCLAGYRAMAADWGYGALANRDVPALLARWG